MWRIIDISNECLCTLDKEKSRFAENDILTSPLPLELVAVLFRIFSRIIFEKSILPHFIYNVYLLRSHKLQMYLRFLEN